MRVNAIHIYPVKSVAGVSLERGVLDRRGLEGDRRWMVVDADGHFVTQRKHAALARIVLADAGETWRLCVDGDELTLPKKHGGQTRRVRVWESDVDAAPYPPASAMLSALLGMDASLVYMPDDAPRRSKVGGAPLSFADGYPLLAIGEASITDLNGRLADPVDARRFRPNLLFEGGEPYAEDRWERVRIGGIPMRAAKRCERCTLVNVDPDSASRGAEPLRTLASYRKDGGKVWFGVNLVHERTGELRVGESVVAG